MLHRGVYERIVRDYNRGEAIPATVTTTVDAPPNSGLGSSSALVVALVEAYRSFLGIPLGAYELARLAFEIERVDLNLPGGRQDQYSAAFGGTNFIEFLPRDRVIVNPLRLSDAIRNELELSLVVCFAGGARDTNAIITQQTAGVADHRAGTMNAMDRLKADAIEMKNALLLGDIPGMARLLADFLGGKAANRHRGVEPTYRRVVRSRLCRGRSSRQGFGRRRRRIPDVHRPTRGSARPDHRTRLRWRRPAR